MKRIFPLLLILVLLTGCAANERDLDRAMTLRAKLLAQGVTFDAGITADYGDKTYTFGMHCEADAQGNLQFTVTEPESICGITGTISAAGGKLTFDDAVLGFELMADGQITPVSAPWVLMKTLRSGYLTSCTEEAELLRVAIDDSYDDDALHLDIWLDSQDRPLRAEIIWQGRRLLSMDVTNFAFV